MTAAPMKPSEALRKAAEIVLPPNAWTTDAFARNGNGDEVSFDDPTAKCFCSYGAMYKAVGSVCSLILAEVEEYFCEAADARYPDLWNDDPARTQSDVVNAFLRGAALAEAKGQ